MTASVAPSRDRKKLLAKIAAVQKQADSAKKVAKLAKVGLKTAKQKFKEAKHAAKKLRKEVKSLKIELVGLAAKKKLVRKSTDRRPKEVKKVDVVPVLSAPELAFVPVEGSPPSAPATQ